MWVCAGYQIGRTFVNDSINNEHLSSRRSEPTPVHPRFLRPDTRRHRARHVGRRPFFDPISVLSHENIATPSANAGHAWQWGSPENVPRELRRLHTALTSQMYFTHCTSQYIRDKPPSFYCLFILLHSDLHEAAFPLYFHSNRRRCWTKLETFHFSSLKKIFNTKYSRIYSLFPTFSIIKIKLKMELYVYI